MRCWTEVMSTLLTEERSRTMALRVGLSGSGITGRPRRGPGSFQGRSWGHVSEEAEDLVGKCLLQVCHMKRDWSCESP